MKYDIYQGDILKIEGLKVPVLVASKDLFNRSGEVIGCPLYLNGQEGPTHIRVHGDDFEGLVHCEKLSLLDLEARSHLRTGSIRVADRLIVSDTIQGLFDYI